MIEKTKSKCKQKHCDDLDNDQCPWYDEIVQEGYDSAMDEVVECERDHGEGAIYVIQQVFDRIGPALDRNTDWMKCREEPWVSLSGVLCGQAV